jgi:hypothetical protein
MSAPYQLVESLHAHDGPIRCAAIGPSGEIVTGCQSDAPNFRVWRREGLELREVGTPVYHDHWVVAITSLGADPGRAYCPEVCVCVCVCLYGE